ncbi:MULTISPECIES: putative glycoside hydrolase [Fusobacterium]|uniref:Putative glycoside hydrolase n=1 Tax=Fusobacterium hominis TaxID=2764326 RepID=A0A7G9GUC5_9FUSO|nr:MULTISPECIES: putative glycoside hydrolase [Fusobacterium]QNM14407.1 putative glycoside hydrolase [Fusobacterium hominis]
MNKQKKFMTGILGAIAVYIAVITATADITRGIGLEEKQPPSENVQVSSNEADTTNLKAEQEHSLEGYNTSLEKVENASAESNNTEITSQPTEVKTINYSFTNKQKSNIFDNPNNGKVMDTLIKATRVEVEEEKDVENQKQTKVKKADGTFEIKVTGQINKWAKIKYQKNLKNKEGWIKAENLNKEFNSVISADLKNIDFSPVEKPNFTENPKKTNVRGIYLTVYSAASDKKMDELIALTKRTPINAFVIDVKDDSGHLLFKTDAEKTYLGENKKYYPIADMEKFMKKLKDNNIYTIARIVSFKDPRYAKKNPDKAIIKRADGTPYTNSDGVIWVSAHDRNLWKYNIDVAKEAAKLGFNEIQFDYVRFPASNGGKLDKQLDYRNVKSETKPETIQKYLKYARKELQPLGVYISADVYGQVGSSADDMGLGQHWETVSNEVDIISPMAYPSHYGNGVYGLSVPDANPYATIYRSTIDGVNRNNNITYPANVRPWLQAFTAKWVKGYIPYGKKEIDAQVKALKDLGINEYLLWSPSNRYGIVEK